jgi:hypothetical protein
VNKKVQAVGSGARRGGRRRVVERKEMEESAGMDIEVKYNIH